MKLSIAWILRCTRYLQKVNTVNEPITVEELNEAEKEIIVLVQKQAFANEYFQLSSKSKDHVSKTSSLRPLNPFVYEGMLRVGAGIDRSAMAFEVKHPVILPSHHHVTKLIVEDLSSIITLACLILGLHYDKVSGSSG